MWVRLPLPAPQKTELRLGFLFTKILAKDTLFSHMHNHQPTDYTCPFCRLLGGIDDEINRQEYIVYQDADTLAFVSPKWWINNPGNVLVVSKKHVENIYDIPTDLLGKVYATAKHMALAIRESYPAQGTSMRQHNEPAGNQDVWHFHVHVFPRYDHDELYKNHDNKHWVQPEERMVFVKKIKEYLLENPAI